MMMIERWGWGGSEGRMACVGVRVRAGDVRRESGVEMEGAAPAAHSGRSGQWGSLANEPVAA